MKRSDINPLPQFFEKYIKIADDIEIVEGLKKYSNLTSEKELSILKEVADKKYAPEKWTTKEVIQHIIDNERIQSYRAMRISRNDKTVLPGYDENLLASNCNANKRKIEDLIEEFKIVRASNVILFESFDKEMLLREGTCYKVNISVLSLGFVLIGHQIHHMNVLRERYFPLKH